MPSYTIEADPSDAWVVCSSGTYSAARDGTGTLSVNSGSSPDYVIVGQQVTASVYYCIEYFVAFDTTAVLGVPVSCGLSVLSSDMTISTRNNDFTVEARAYDWGAAVTSGDFVPGASLGSYPLLATRDSSEFTENDWVAFIENGSEFADNINVGGTTRLVIASSRHRLGTVPDAGPGGGSATDSYEEVFFRQVESTADAPPTLVIVTAVAGWGVGMVRMGAN